MAKVIIVGGGVAGLSAGIYALLSGHEAVIYENHTVAGGNLTGWQRGAYHIDNCIHWLTGTNDRTETYKMWQTLGVLDGGIYRPNSLYTCELDGERLSLCRGIENLESALINVSPSDYKPIRELIGAVRAAAVLCGLEDGNKLCAMKLLKYYKMTAGELAGEFSHPLIKMFLSSFLTEDFGSLGLIFVFASFCYGNADLPCGGSKKAAERMTEKFLSLGGELQTGVGASKLLFRKNIAKKVLLTNGKDDSADFFILTADPDPSYKKLTGRSLPKALFKMENDGRLRRFSSVHCAFSCPLPLDFDCDFIFEMAGDAKKVLGAKYLALRQFSHESSYAPDGETVLQAFYFCREPRCRRMIALSENAEEYKKYKEKIANTIQNQIIAKFPSLFKKLSLLDVWTPATYKKFTGAGCGTYMSYAFSSHYLPRLCGNRADGFKNVILATQWQQAPGGLPTAASAGKLAVETVDRLSRRR